MTRVDEQGYILAQQWKQPLEEASEVVIDALLNQHAGIADMQELVEALHHAASTFDQLGASVNGIGQLFGNTKSKPEPLDQGCLHLGSTLVQWDDAIAIHTHGDALFEAVRSLVAQAKKAKKGAAITVDVVATHPETVQIIMTDDCGGIPETIIRRFEKGELTMYENFGGLEMGLLLSDRLVTEVLKGTLQIQSPRTHSDGTIGTRYIITIPDLNEQ